MKLKYYIWTLLGILAFSACSDDEGNYDYIDINEVSVTGIEEGKLYSKIAFVDNLTFDPQIESSMGQTDDADYEFEWKLIPSGTDFDMIEDVGGMTISRERKLDVLLTATPGEYKCFFIVKDKKTGIAWTTYFQLQVKSMTSEGWLVLCEENEKARLDIVFNVDQNNDLIAYNIWRNSTFDPGKPQRIIYNYQLNRQETLLLTDKSTYQLDRKELTVEEGNNLIYLFGEIPDAVHLQASAISQFDMTNYWMVMDEHNNLYRLIVTEAGGIFDYPVNVKSNGERYELAPFIGIALGNGNIGRIVALLYDKVNKRFMTLCNDASYPSVIQFDSGNLFTAETGRDMVYMESANSSGIIFSLLRDPADNQLYFYGIKSSATYKDPPSYMWWADGEYKEHNSQEYYGQVSGSGTDVASMFAFHHQFPYLFYVNGNSIYQFDMARPEVPAREVLSFPGEEIKVMKFVPFVAWEAYADWERARGLCLVVGTNVEGKAEAECGIMRTYEVPNLMKPLVLKKEHTGLGKIVDITYKERSKQK